MFKTCLLAVDIGDGAVPASLVDAAVRIAQNDGATLHVVNVVPDSGMSIVDQYLGPDHASKVVEGAKTHLAEWAAATLPDGMASHLHVAQGTVYDQILKAAQAVNADLILVGAHRPVLKDYLVGPNAARVVRHATQSVMVIR